VPPMASRVYGSCSQTCFVTVANATAATRLIEFCTDGSYNEWPFDPSNSNTKTLSGVSQYQGKDCAYETNDGTLVGGLSYADGDGGDGIAYLAPHLFQRVTPIPLKVEWLKVISFAEARCVILKSAQSSHFQLTGVNDHAIHATSPGVFSHREEDVPAGAVMFCNQPVMAFGDEVSNSGFNTHDEYQIIAPALPALLAEEFQQATLRWFQVDDDVTHRDGHDAACNTDWSWTSQRQVCLSTGLDLCFYRDLCPDGEDNSPAFGGDWSLVTGEEWMPVLTVAGGKDWVHVGSGPHPQCRSHVAHAEYPDHWAQGDIYGNVLLCCPQTGLSSPSPVAICSASPMPPPLVPTPVPRPAPKARSQTPSKEVVEEDEKEKGNHGVGVLSAIVTILVVIMVVWMCTKRYRNQTGSTSKVRSSTDVGEAERVQSTQTISAMQTFLDQTFRDRSYKGQFKPQKLQVMELYRVKNYSAMADLEEYKNELRERRGTCQPLNEQVLSANPPPQLEANSDPTLNEYLMFHGTNAEAAHAIIETDFRLPKNHTHGAVYGAGIYIAETNTKAHMYCSPDSRGWVPILVVRTILGHIHDTNVESPDTDELLRMARTGVVESVCGDRRKLRYNFSGWREFIVYNNAQVAVEWLVWCKPK